MGYRCSTSQCFKGYSWLHSVLYSNGYVVDDRRIKQWQKSKEN